jgi:ABC-2 type transport system ATP-binding protein
VIAGPDAPASGCMTAKADGTAAAPAVAAGDVAIARGGRRLLYGVTLAVRAGEIACVEGANASGKTSLLRVLAGLAAPAAGTVERAERECAFVPERAALAPRVRPLSWLRAMDAIRGRRRSWPDAATPWGLDAEVLARPVATLSKGRLQRVLLAEALTARVGLLLLDEPWAGLDAGARDLLGRALRDRADEGAAVVLTDHTGARHGRLRADAVWRVEDGGVHRGADSLPSVLIVASRDGQRAERTVPRGEHDALLAGLLRDGWSIESVRTP